jgi:molybdate transport system substrate-binding protein
MPFTRSNCGACLCYHYSHIDQESMMQMGLRNLSLFMLAVMVLACLPAHAAEVSVAATADFAAPLERLAPLFQKESGNSVKVTAGASGRLYAQIKAGAAFDVFLSADEELPKQLMQDGRADGGSRFVYATGRLVLWSAQDDLVDEKGAVLNRGNFNMLAIANPRYSPYGVAAKETLTKLTMWNAIQEKLTKGENTTQAWQLAATEKADLALIALSQVMRDGKVREGSAWIVPHELHNPIHQGAVLLKGAKDPAAAKAFLNFLKSEKARAVMRGFGYESP